MLLLRGYGDDLIVFYCVLYVFFVLVYWQLFLEKFEFFLNVNMLQIDNLIFEVFMI